MSKETEKILHNIWEASYNKGNTAWSSKKDRHCDIDYSIFNGTGFEQVTIDAIAEFCKTAWERGYDESKPKFEVEIFGEQE